MGCFVKGNFVVAISNRLFVSRNDRKEFAKNTKVFYFRTLMTRIERIPTDFVGAISNRLFVSCNVRKKFAKNTKVLGFFCTQIFMDYVDLRGYSRAISNRQTMWDADNTEIAPTIDKQCNGVITNISDLKIIIFQLLYSFHPLFQLSYFHIVLPARTFL